MNPTQLDAVRSRGARREAFTLGLFFGAMYFIQGIGEPTEGLVAQPVQSMLKSWGCDAAEIGAFVAILSLPWMVKPVYGLLTDFVPVAGYRRKSYLLLVSGASVVGFSLLYVLLSVHALPEGAVAALLLLLLLPNLGVAFSDVVVDALMVEKGQPRGLTGRLQSIQWAAMYAAAVVLGVLGGYLTEHGQQDLAFLICAVVASMSLLLTWIFVDERRTRASRAGLKAAAGSLWKACRSPAVLAVGGFLFLWNFNPFYFSALYVHMTGKEGLGFDEQFYGNTKSLQAVAAIVASVSYGLYCRRVRFRLLVHLSIVAGIVATVAYWGLLDRTSAVCVIVVAGFTYMTGTLIQLDLAARVCPPEAAGTVFALLMSLVNLSDSLATAVGGYVYDRGAALWGNQAAFNVLVALGALATAGCWILVPVLNRYHAGWVAGQEVAGRTAENALRPGNVRPDRLE